MIKKDRKVLLAIRDTSISKKLGNELIKRFQFDVEVALSGEDAINIVKATPWAYDVIVIYDKFEECFDGLEVLKYFKKNFASIEIIFLIPSSDKSSNDVWREGAFNCFYYPINFEGIAYAVKFAREHAKLCRKEKMLNQLQHLSVQINLKTELLEIQKLACKAATEIFDADHSGLVIFGKDLLIGEVIAEYPETENFVKTIIKVKEVPLEQNLVHNQEIINIDNIESCEGLGEVKATLINLGVRSCLILPVVLRDKVIASISLDMKTKNRFFYQDEIDLYKKLANQVAVAIGKAKNMQELYLLNRISNYINSVAGNLNIKKLLEIIRNQAGTLLDVTNFYIALYDKKKEEYSFPFHYDIKDKPETIPKEEMRKGLTEYVRLTKKSLLVDEKKYNSLIKKNLIELVGEKTKIWLGAPLIVREKALGVMVVQSYENENAYDSHDLELLETLASQTAIAIDNAHLFHRRIRDMEIISNIVRTISTKLDTSTLFKTMVAQIAEKLQCSHCSLFMPQKINNQILLVPEEIHGTDAEIIKTRNFKPGEGLAGWVFEHGDSIVVEDARDDHRFVESRRRGKFPHSMLVSPIIVGKRTIGVVCADQDAHGWFDENDRKLVDTLTRHAGIAIERAIGLNLIQEISSQLISSKDEEEILQNIVTGAIKLTNTTSGIIYLISNDGNSITKRFPFPQDSKHPEPRMGYKKGLTRQIIDKKQIIVIPDINEAHNINPEHSKTNKSVIGVPLKNDEKVVGVLYLNDIKKHCLTESEQSLLEILAVQAAIAIFNSNLFKEIQALYEASQEIAKKSQDLKSALDIIVKTAVQLSNATIALILFRDDSSRRIRVVCNYGPGSVVFKGLELGINEGFSAKVFETGKLLYENEYHMHSERARILDEPKYKKLFKALAAVPLIWEGKTEAVIAVISPSYFSDKEIELLERFSAPASITIAIAREFSFQKALLNNSPDPIVAVNRSGLVKEFNKASADLSGYQINEVINLPVEILWGGREKAKQIKQGLYQAKDSKVRDLETYVQSKSGEKIPVLFSGSLVYTEAYGGEKEEIGSIGQVEDQRFVSLRGKPLRLVKAIKEINEYDELPDVVDAVIKSSVNLFNADTGYILLKEGDYLTKYGIPQEAGHKIKIDKEIGNIIKRGVPRAITSYPISFLGFQISSKGKSGLLIPLKSDKNSIGAIYLESCNKNYFREEDELITFLSAEAAVAINRAQLKLESEQLQLLKKIGDEIRKKGEFQKYKDTIVKISKQLLKSEISTIFLYDKSNRRLIREIWYPKMKELDELEENYSDKDDTRGITGRVLNLCEDKHIDHIIYDKEEDILKDALASHITVYKNLNSWKKERFKYATCPIQHFLAVPIYGEMGKVFGALRVMNKTSKDYTEDNPKLDSQGFRDPEDVKLLKTIASLLSQGLSSERKAKKLSTLSDITDIISEQDDIQRIGDCLVKSVVNRLQYSACSMRLIKGDKLELLSQFGFKSDIGVKELAVTRIDGFVGRAITSNESAVAFDILSNDIEENKGYLHKEFAKSEGLRSACCVPIKVSDNKAIGVITIYMREAPYFFPDYEVKNNFDSIAATCSIALRKVQAVKNLQKLLEILEGVHIFNTKIEVLESCIDEMLTIFDAHAALIYEIEKEIVGEGSKLQNILLYHKSISSDFKLPVYIQHRIELNKESWILNGNEFPLEWNSLKNMYSQCLVFPLEFQEEIIGVTVLFTKIGVLSILPEVERFKLATAISHQLGIAFKNIEFIDEIKRVRAASPAILSAQYVAGMIHELASSANKGKGAVTYMQGTPEYNKIKNKNWKIECSKIESAFDDIGRFTSKALKIKNMGRLNFERTLEYRSINKAIRDILHDVNHEIRKKSANISWNYNKDHDSMHAYFDEILIKQAIRNLISNSLRWIYDGGNIKVISSQKGDYISVLIEDDGQGITEGTEKKIFEPYFTTSQNGYGIGLFFVTNVVKMHEGELKIVNQRNPTVFEMKIYSKLKEGE